MVIVIGGGPSGIMAAIAASQLNDVLLLEKQESLGRKLLMTGNGRCNLTNDRLITEFVLDCYGETKFLYTHLNRFGPQQIIEFFESRHCPLVLENHRYYPQSMKARDVLKVLEQELRKKVTVRTNSPVQSLIIKDHRIAGVQLENETIPCDHVILATGGLSYPRTGSSGDGFRWLKESQHQISPLFGSEVGLVSQDSFIKELVGLSLQKVSVTLRANSTRPHTLVGDVIFTHKGISGPAVLDLSYHVQKYLQQKASVSLELQILNETLNFDSSKTIRNYLEYYLPKRLVSTLLKLTKMNESSPTNQLTKQERLALKDIIHAFPITIQKSLPIEQAVVTAGGLRMNQIDVKTLKSKLISNLSICGELLDVVGPVGGYNLTIALSTGFGAGSSISV